MGRRINKVKLFVNDNEQSIIVAKDLELELLKYGFKIVNRNYDLAISVGGDGSFLRMVKDNKFNEKILYIGVNSGTLGFLQEIAFKTDYVSYSLIASALLDTDGVAEWTELSINKGTSNVAIGVEEVAILKEVNVYE